MRRKSTESLATKAFYFVYLIYIFLYFTHSSGREYFFYYHNFTLALSAMYILLPGFTLNAS